MRGVLLAHAGSQIRVPFAKVADHGRIREFTFPVLGCSVHDGQGRPVTCADEGILRQLVRAATGGGSNDEEAQREQRNREPGTRTVGCDVPDRFCAHVRANGSEVGGYSVEILNRRGLLR